MKKIYILFILLSGLAFGEQGAKYLIITNDMFYNEVQPLANWKTKKGIPAKVVPLSVTGNNPVQIKTYIQNAYNTWNPRPEYVLLVGSGVRLPAINNSDDYYVDLAGVGNPLIELSVGRFPCMYLRQCSTMVAKTLSYEHTPYMSDTIWYRKGTTIVDEDPEAESVYWTDVRYIHSLWRSDNYLHIDSFSYVRGNTTADVVNAVNDGRAFLAERGEATVNWWHFEFYPQYTNNGYKLPIVVSATCATLSLSDTSYLGDQFLIAGRPNNPKGAVGFFGTTIATSGPGLGRLRGTVAQGFFRSVFQDGVYKLGDAAKRAKFILDSIRPPNYVDARYHEWNLLGDPELNMYTGVPKPLTVIHDTIIQTGPQTYSVLVFQSGNPVANALVCAMMDSTIYQYGYTNSAGLVSFTIYSPSQGVMSVTVTARNCLPYEKNVNILPGGNVHDVSPVSIVSPTYQVIAGSQIIPKVLVRNWGGYTDTFSVAFKINNIYQNTISSVVLGANDTATISFPVWNAIVGSYSATAYTTLADDQWHANDTTRLSFNVITPNDVGVEMILNPDTIHSLNRVTIPKVKIMNYGMLAQTNFAVVCSIFGHNNILRYSDTKITSVEAGYDTIVLFAAWTPNAIETCLVRISTALAGDENMNNNTITRLTVINSNYIDNFEESDGGYHPNPIINGWKWGVPNAGPFMSHSGTKCWATGLDAYYSINANWRLISPAFTANTDNPVLKFWHWYDMDEYYDGGNVKISLDSGASWILLHPQVGYPAFVFYTNQGIPNESCYTGMHDWDEATFTLPVLSGQRFLICWHFGSSQYNPGPGWYIDDITGIGITVQSPMVNDVGIDSIMYPPLYASLNVYLQPQALVKNFGILPQNNFPVVCSIVNNSGILRYTDTKNITLATSRDTIIYFASWQPMQTEQCAVKMRTGLVGDENQSNDNKISFCEVRWVLFDEGFEEPYFPPTGWVTYNNDGGTKCWVRGTVSPYTGVASAESQFESSTLRNDDWLVTPSINIPTSAAELRYWFRSHNTVNFESLEVRLSTTGNAMSDFNTILGSHHFNNTNYLENVIPLNSYAGQDIYLAFINKGLYQRKIYIDDVMVKAFTMSIEEQKPNNQILTTTLYSVKPNPISNRFTTISFSLAEPLKVSLKIYDASGRIVKTLVNKPLGRGMYNFVWNGKTDQSKPVAQGVYFYTLDIPRQRFSRKLIFTQ